MKTSSRALALITSSVLGLFACAAPIVSGGTAAGAMAARSAAHEPLLPAPSGPLDLTVAEGGTLSLADLLARLSKLTGVTFSCEGATGERLKNTPVVITQDRRLPGGEVYPWIESILQQNGYSLGVLQQGAAPLVGVYFNNAARQSNPPTISVEVERIEEFRRHPALLVTTVLTLSNTDVRTLAKSLRALTSDSPSGMVFPVGNAHSVVLSGSGQQVANLVQVLRTIDARATPAAQIGDPGQP